MSQLSYKIGISCLLLLSLFHTSCTNLIFDAPYPDPGQGKVAVVFSRPELLLPEGTEPYFGRITSLRLIATNLRGEVVYNQRLRYKGADRNLSWRQLSCSDPVVLDQSTYEFFFIANEEGIGINAEEFMRINSKQALLGLTYFIPLSRPERLPFLIPLVGHLQRQLPRAEESDRTIPLTPQLSPSVALLEIHTEGFPKGSIELGFPKDREDGGLFGYPYSKASDRRHEMNYYPLTPLEKGGTIYCVGVPEVWCYAPEQQQWRGPELSEMTHLRITLPDGETKYLPLMQLPPEQRTDNYEEYLRIAMQPAPIGPNALIERFSIFRGDHYRYQLSRGALSDRSDRSDRSDESEKELAEVFPHTTQPNLLAEVMDQHPKGATQLAPGRRPAGYEVPFPHDPCGRTNRCESAHKGSNIENVARSAILGLVVGVDEAVGF